MMLLTRTPVDLKNGTKAALVIIAPDVFIADEFQIWGTCALFSNWQRLTQPGIFGLAAEFQDWLPLEPEPITAYASAVNVCRRLKVITAPVFVDGPFPIVPPIGNTCAVCASAYTAIVTGSTLPGFDGTYTLARVSDCRYEGDNENGKHGVLSFIIAGPLTLQFNLQIEAIQNFHKPFLSLCPPGDYIDLNPLSTAAATITP